MHEHCDDPQDTKIATHIFRPVSLSGRRCGCPSSLRDMGTMAAEGHGVH